jgi:hypothetical protein
MATPIDYVAAATAVAESASEPEAGASPEAPAVQETQPAPVADIVTPAPAPAPSETKPEPVSRVAKSFEDLARERVALRGEREKLKTEGAELSRSRALADAAAKGDAMALLAAAGIPWSKAAQQVLEGHGVKPPVESEAPQADDPREARLAALERELSTSKAQAARENVLGQVRARVASDATKFRFTASLKAEAEAIRYLEQFHNETGELPGSNIEESLEIALEAVEAHYTAEAKKWAGLLTPGSGPVTLPISKPVVPPVGVVSQQAAPKTLTNNVGSGPSSATPGEKPGRKSDDDYIIAAIQAANQY